MQKRQNNSKKCITIFIIIAILIITMGIFSFLKKDMGYKKITLKDIETNKDELDNKKVVYEGAYMGNFEPFLKSLLDKKIYVETNSETIFIPKIEQFPGFSSNYYNIKVRIYGLLITKDGNYGYQGLAKYKIIASKIELLN